MSAMSLIEKRAARAKLPHTVYRFLTSGGNVLYVGCAEKLAKRVAQHKRKTWWKLVTTTLTEVFPNEPAALAEETRLIKELAPPYNRQKNDIAQLGLDEKRRQHRASLKLARQHALEKRSPVCKCERLKPIDRPYCDDCERDYQLELGRTRTDNKGPKYREAHRYGVCNVEGCGIVGPRNGGMCPGHYREYFRARSARLRAQA